MCLVPFLVVTLLKFASKLFAARKRLFSIWFWEFCRHYLWCHIGCHTESRIPEYAGTTFSFYSTFRDSQTLPRLFCQVATSSLPCFGKISEKSLSIWGRFFTFKLCFIGTSEKRNHNQYWMVKRGKNIYRRFPSRHLGKYMQLLFIHDKKYQS